MTDNIKEYLNKLIKEDTINVDTRTNLIEKKEKYKIEKKNEIINIFGNATNMDEFKSIFAPESRYKRMLLSFDTENRDLINSKNGKLAWTVVASKDYRQGVVNSREEIRNIVGLRLYPFRMRTSDCALTVPIVRWMLLIDEFKAQSCYMGNGNSYHFITTIVSKSPADVGAPIYYNMTMHNFNQGYYWFRKPITVLNSITLTTFNVSGQVNINIENPNQIVAQPLDNSNPLEIDLSTTPDFAEKIGPNSIILISGFECDDPITNQQLILQVNSYEGGITFTSGNIISIPIDGTNASLCSNIIITIVPTRSVYPIEFIYTK